MKKTNEELIEVYQSIIDKYGEVESINYWSAFDEYEERLKNKLEKTQDVRQINDYLSDCIYEFIENVINIYNDDLEKDTITKIDAYLDYTDNFEVKRLENAHHILKIGEYAILEEVLQDYHRERIEILEKELIDEKSNQMEM